MLYINNATIITPTRTIEGGAVLVEEQRIRAVGPAQAVPCPPAATRIDAEGLVLAPGYIDLQLNGAFGADFTANPATIWEVAAGLPRYGVTAFLPTIVTSPPATVSAAQEALAGGPPDGWRGARPIGLHLEGPFLNPARKGAHNPNYIRRPSLEAVADWSPERGVLLVTLAPEQPGAEEVIGALAGRGIVVSAGHSLATYDEAHAAFAAGVRYGTHLFNAMTPLNHREPGLPGALLADGAATVGIIPDGEHVHPAAVALAWRALGPRRLNLVTDAMSALGMPPGHYRLGDFDVSVDETTARLVDGTLAGSILALDDAVRKLMAFTGCSLAEALPTVTATPAELLGMDKQIGVIAPGADADLVLLTPAGEVVATFARGQLVYDLGVPQAAAEQA